MANSNAKKKLDEYHTKVLRELGSVPCNKNCFDCNQRGPTYLNVTIGSFVCTKCSGLLRGLTPPHRVKSISMTTFLPEEIEMLKSRGNDYCRNVWLGLYSDQNTVQYKDEQQIRDFMIDKYEKKRYYIDPATLPNIKPTPQPTTTQISQPQSQSNIQRPHPISLRTTQITLTNGTSNRSDINKLSNSNISNKSSHNKMNQSNTNNNSLSNGLFQVDFNNAPRDPFSSNHISSPPTNSSINQFIPNSISSSSPNNSESVQEASFANFDNAVFTSVQGIAGLNEPNRKLMPMSSPLEIQKEDKYAALKDLDCIMKQQHHISTSTNKASVDNENINTNGWNSANAFDSPSTGGSMFSSPNTSNGSVFGSPNLNGSVFNTPHTYGFGTLNIINGGGSSTNGSLFGSPSTNGGSIFGSPRSTDSPLTNGVDVPVANPFNSNANPFRNNPADQWGGQALQNGGTLLSNGFPMSQSLDFNSIKSPWPMVNHQIANPFKMNTATPQTTAPHHASNPFL